MVEPRNENFSSANTGVIRDWIAGELEHRIVFVIQIFTSIYFIKLKTSIETAIARLAQSVERETLSLSRSNRHDYSVHLKVVGSTPTSGLYVFFFLLSSSPLSCMFEAKYCFFFVCYVVGLKSTCWVIGETRKFVFVAFD
ncbi:hypothetical protein COCC4DRAFT_134525 [Bipolaris maydis ATCC 48331]|uniref:Uncharacterized protein n=1 Tax=Cochliobolus heterostrophus (strain C4 / ATCC 48331 / race T) TaxID=665024 RepID=N4XJK9_COCH4|nr:uncharacterized protein COCC4DRAFT_134525 [Bipolaris maydis ATCC 48331]ENI06711.1 hypothetical protein COCC4DRAFT_134525 [Bipolaris maydis ATCC 48331]